MFENIIEKVTEVLAVPMTTGMVKGVVRGAIKVVAEAPVDKTKPEYTADTIAKRTVEQSFKSYKKLSAIKFAVKKVKKAFTGKSLKSKECYEHDYTHLLSKTLLENGLRDSQGILLSLQKECYQSNFIARLVSFLSTIKKEFNIKNKNPDKLLHKVLSEEKYNKNERERLEKVIRRELINETDALNQLNKMIDENIHTLEQQLAQEVRQAEAENNFQFISELTINLIKKVWKFMFSSPSLPTTNNINHPLAQQTNPLENNHLQSLLWKSLLERYEIENKSSSEKIIFLKAEQDKINDFLKEKNIEQKPNKSYIEDLVVFFHNTHNDISIKKCEDDAAKKQMRNASELTENEIPNKKKPRNYSFNLKSNLFHDVTTNNEEQKKPTNTVSQPKKNLVA